MNQKTLFLNCLIFALIAFFSGCTDSDNTAKADPKKEPIKTETRPETKVIEAVDAVGYDGAAVRKKVDNLLDKTEENNKKLEEMNELKE